MGRCRRDTPSRRHRAAIMVVSMPCDDRDRLYLAEMARTDQTRLDELHQMVRMWVWALDNTDAVDFVRQSNLDVIRNQIHRERSALMDSGIPHDEWTMRWSEGYVLPKIDKLISDRDNKRAIFA